MKSRGIYVTMITPYTEDNRINYGVMEEMVEWYIKNGLHGIFAVCQSSEMFYLSRNERKELASFIVKKVNGRIPVVVSGHVSESEDEQIADVFDAYEQGASSVILLTNKFAAKDDPEGTFTRNLGSFIDKIPEGIPLGLYECPAPYKYVLSNKDMEWVIQSKRFNFFKDTCCDAEIIKDRIGLVKGTDFSLFNANGGTFYETLKAGACGYSGIMANFHPDLYVWLFNNYKKHPKEADLVASFLAMSAIIETRVYPACAKYHMQRYFKQMLTDSRSCNASLLKDFMKDEVDAMENVAQYIRNIIRSI
jgi:4-hydroxy-tetrahydrodipicolinate synthase